MTLHRVVQHFIRRPHIFTRVWRIFTGQKVVVEKVELIESSLEVLEHVDTQAEASSEPAY